MQVKEKVNKKVRNATLCEYDGIKFKSKLELFCYRKLKEIVLDPGYESWKEVLMDGFYPELTTIYEPNGDKDLVLNGKKVRDITYTPDFFFEINGKAVFIDTKGRANDAYPLKKKMFLKNNERSNIPVFFFEPHNQRQVLQCIEIIKNL